MPAPLQGPSRFRRLAHFAVGCLVPLSLLASAPALAIPETCDLIYIPQIDFYEYRCQVDLDATFVDSQFGPELVDGVSSVVAAPRRPDSEEVIAHASEVLWIDIDTYIALARGILWVPFDDDAGGILTGPPLKENGATVDPETGTITFEYQNGSYDATTTYQFSKLMPDASRGYLLRQTYTIKNKIATSKYLKIFNLHWIELNAGREFAWADAEGAVAQISGSIPRKAIRVSRPVSTNIEPEAFEFELYTREQRAIGTCGDYEYIPGVPCGSDPGSPTGRQVILNPFIIENGGQRTWPADDPGQWQGAELGDAGGPVEHAYAWETELATSETFSVTLESYVYRPVKSFKPGLEQWLQPLPEWVTDAFDVYAQELPEPSSGILQAAAVLAVVGLRRRRARVR